MKFETDKSFFLARTLHPRDLAKLILEVTFLFDEHFGLFPQDCILYFDMKEDMIALRLNYRNGEFLLGTLYPITAEEERDTLRTQGKSKRLEHYTLHFTT